MALNSCWGKISSVGSSVEMPVSGQIFFWFCRLLQSSPVDHFKMEGKIILLAIILSALVPVYAPGKGMCSRNSHSRKREWLALSKLACLSLKDFGICDVLNKDVECSHHVSLSGGVIFSLQLHVSVTC